MTFPGAYKGFRNEPGLYFDIWRNVSPYPIPGPPVYVPRGSPKLDPLPYETLASPTGDAKTDMRYFGAMTLEILRSDAFALSVNSQSLGYGPNLNFTGPPPGSVPKGAIVRGL